MSYVAPVCNVLSSAFYVGGNIFSIHALEHVPALQILIFRWLWLGMGTFSFAYVSRREELYHMHLLGEHGSKSTLLLMSLLRAGDSVFWLLGLQYISLAEANAIVYSSPVFAHILGHFVLRGPEHEHERVQWTALVALGVSVVGVLLIVHPWDLDQADTSTTGSVPLHVVGVCCELGTALCLAGYQILGRKHQHRLSSLAVVLAFSLHAALLGCLFLLSLSFSGVDNVLVAMNGRDRWNVCGYTLLGSIGHVLQLLSFQQGNVSTMALLGYVEPVLSVVAQLLVLGQPISTLSAVGCVLIIGSGVPKVLMDRQSTATTTAAGGGCSGGDKSASSSFIEAVSLDDSALEDDTDGLSHSDMGDAVHHADQNDDRTTLLSWVEWGV